ncbi:thioredoxin family protein [Winogradskyella sp. 3972H.M.0a.05]|uniref:thioredoxin family protein n=1 Tax=Winogradskyella sp. 3972H.M.0a.05 TaxID=2950277 RepID=UPI0033955BB3
MEMILDKTIETALESSITYNDYRALVADQVEHKQTSGDNQSEALINYTMLNDRRMKRWDKTVKVDPESVETIQSFSGDTTWLVISESWCGDAAHLLPVMHKFSELNPNIKLRIVFRDEHLELMDQYLTNGGRSIPKLIMINNATGDVVNTYGPRPSVATEMVNAYKAEHGQLTPEFKEDLQRWYNKDKGQTAIKDLKGILGI